MPADNLSQYFLLEWDMSGSLQGARGAPVVARITVSQDGAARGILAVFELRISFRDRVRFPHLISGRHESRFLGDSTLPYKNWLAPRE